MSDKSDEVRQFIIENVRTHPKAIAAIVAEKFGFTRQTASYHLSKLVEDGVLEAKGETNAREYALASLESHIVTLPASSSLEEDRVWDENFAKRISVIAPPHVQDICFYGFTEMFNNAIDHSDGSQFEVLYIQTAADVRFWIDDNGIGIFNKIALALKLEDPRFSILELSKGKLTTDPDHHTGEGIFFTSRVFRRFAILSQTLAFLHPGIDEDDWLLQSAEKHHDGTSVMMQIDLNHKGTLKETFDKFSSGEAGDYGFAKTHVPLKLALIGDSNLISRSQAKRVLARFEKFEEVMLDFEGIKFIGQSFADEIFRVFARKNPQIKLVPLNANEEVLKMIQRAQSGEVSISETDSPSS